MIFSSWVVTLLSCTLAAQGTLAITVNIDDLSSLKSAAKTVASDMITYYNDRASNNIPGKLDDTWWEGGSMFMILIQYWFLTGDTQFNNVVQDGMYWQKGDDNFFPSNYSQYLGNDDQVFWGLAAITAAELNYPERTGQPSWLSLAQGVFNTQVPRWDTSSCHGGMRWQIWPYQAGYQTKNAISNGGLFQLSARLALYTNNDTYATWAERIWDWSATTPLLRKTWVIADSTSPESQCTDHGDFQWTYNYATYISGAAYMYNYTKGDQKWMEGITGLIKTSDQFYPTGKTFDDADGKILSDITCEPIGKCDRNQITFKAYFSSWLAFMTTIVPDTYDLVMPKLKTSAQAAVQTCTGLSSGTRCGIKWYAQSWDGTDGLEQQMAVLGVLNANMVQSKDQAPFTSDTGGTSKGNPSAGTNSSDDDVPQLNTVNTGDRAGAGILTAVFVTGWVLAVTWMIRGG
ncbi:Six-hairpin glycosidase [Penicillium malachiteum]|uniref:Six-hairpin glycosidase n=1 Tax=Penicillium malachiteum TaxID=1324776 RepID=UPI002546E06E|nr:Six-hairpin glycosidase [Penicillium malachiteum]KAJ5721392.1 Six-hairpin glycosidase [Penicillium malachiteum]